MASSIVVQVVVSCADEETAFCSSIEVSSVPGKHKHSDDYICALLMGLPVGITSNELDIFVDPFLQDIEGIVLLHETRAVECEDSVEVVQIKKSALLFFTSRRAIEQFQDVYNNMQLPSYSETAPCTVIQPACVEAQFMSSMDLADFSSETFAPSPARGSQAMKSISGSPAREPSPCKSSLTEVQYSKGLYRLSQSQVHSFQSIPPLEDYSKSSSPVPLPVLTEYCIPSATDAAQFVSALPSCTVCLRRVRGIGAVSESLAGIAELPIPRSYICPAHLTFDEQGAVTIRGPESVLWDKVVSGAAEGVRCLPCHLYHSVSLESDVQRSVCSGQLSSAVEKTSSKGARNNLGRCRTCGISENVWLCLQCGHAGCGRYTSQHAKSHYHENPSHNLSLELASGRIWNYRTDAFCYFEDDAAEVFMSGRGYGGSARSNSFRSLAEGTDMSRVRAVYVEVGSSSAHLQKFSKVTFHAHSGGKSISHFGRPSRSGRFPTSRSGELDGFEGLDSVTADKIRAMVSNYENLLEAQLLDQQLYFEKLLARETVRALEQSYQSNDGNSTASSKLGKTAQSMRVGAMKASSAAEEMKLQDASNNLHEQSELINSDLTPSSPFLTHSNTFYEASQALKDEEVQRGMQEVEDLKLEISAVEAEYRALLEALRDADEISRQLKKKNDSLIRTQKSLRDQEQDIIMKTEQLRSQSREQIADLEQQIQDLSFYTSTRQRVQESSLRDELRNGTLVTAQMPQPQTGTSTGNNSNSKKQFLRKN